MTFGNYDVGARQQIECIFSIFRCYLNMRHSNEENAMICKTCNALILFIHFIYMFVLISFESAPSNETSLQRWILLYLTLIIVTCSLFSVHVISLVYISISIGPPFYCFTYEFNIRIYELHFECCMFDYYLFIFFLCNDFQLNAKFEYNSFFPSRHLNTYNGFSEFSIRKFATKCFRISLISFSFSLNLYDTNLSSLFFVFKI